ncbi:hypothetical protein M422DRAFT_249096 [Sphaerobolus stellatus SS14]|nr:hypothetical protein M422DRAFT_249096 [Sphaerobolus stellatus SS14]
MQPNIEVNVDNEAEYDACIDTDSLHIPEAQHEPQEELWKLCDLPGDVNPRPFLSGPSISPSLLSQMPEDFIRVQLISISDALQANSLTLTSQPSADSDAPLNPSLDKIEDVQILSEVSEVDIAAAATPITTQPVLVFEAGSQENKNYKAPEDVDPTIPVHNQAQNSDVGGGLDLDRDEDYEGENDGDEDVSTYRSIRDIPPPIKQRSTHNNPTASTQVLPSLRLPDYLLSRILNIFLPFSPILSERKNQEPAEALFGVDLIQVCKKFTVNVVLDTAECWRNVMIRAPCSAPKIIIGTLVQLSGASHLQVLFPELWNVCEERQVATHSLQPHPSRVSE